MKLVANNIEEFMKSQISNYKGISQDVIDSVNDENLSEGYIVFVSCEYLLMKDFSILNYVVVSF